MTLAEGTLQDASAIDQVCRECSTIVSTSGIGPALAWLNARTRFRFTGLYRVDPPLLRNLELFDRENPHINVSGEVRKLDDTYCALVYYSGPFDTPDSARDDRLNGHPSRASVISYAGVPLRRENGEVWGTLCHFDVRPRLLPRGERRLLESVGPVFAASLAPRDADEAESSDRPASGHSGSVERRT